MDRKMINEIIELVKINEHYSEKASVALNYVNACLKGGNNTNEIEHLIAEERKCRKIAADAHDEAMKKIEGTNTFYSIFRLLSKSIENKDLAREEKIRGMIKKKMDEKKAITNAE